MSSHGSAPLLPNTHSPGRLCSASATSISTLTPLTSTTTIVATKTLKSACDLAHVRPARLLRACCAALLFAVGLAGVCVLLHWLANNGSAAIGIIQQSRSAAHRHGHHRAGNAHAPVTLDVRHMPAVRLAADAEQAAARQANCSYWDCFDVYRCGHGAGGGAPRMSVYVYPLHEFVDAESGAAAAPLSRDFHRVLRAIRESVYYTADPLEACVFVPSVDLLNQNRVDGVVASRALASLEL